MTESKTFIKHPIFIGNAIVQLVSTATSATYAYWITNYSKDGYNLTLVISSIIGIIVGLLFTIDALNNLFMKVFKVNVRRTYINFSKFLLIEAVANIVSIVLTVITKTPLCAIIVAIAVTPFSKLQNYGVNELISKTFETASQRKAYDDFLTSVTPFINAIGFAIGFGINHICTGVQAYVLLCIAEIVNNIFYYKAYKLVEDVKVANTAEDTAEDDEEDAEDEAATDAA